MKIQTKKYNVVFGKSTYEFVVSSLKVKPREKVLVKLHSVAKKLKS